MKLVHVATVALTASLLAACAQNPAPQAEDSSNEESVASTSEAYRNMNGRSLNGARSTTMSLKSMTGKSGSGLSVTGVTLAGSSLTATLANKTTVTGSALAKTELAGVDGSGAALAFRIDGVATHPTYSDVLLYNVSTRSGSTYSPLCGVDATGAAVPAIPLFGSWDPREGVKGGGAKTDSTDVVTFACRGFAIGKCVEVVGYRPWAGAATQHASCVRLLRADYCGDGTSYTKDGNPVNISDNAGIQKDDQNWLPEAEWTPDGAKCLTKERFTQLSILTSTGLLGMQSLPTCSLQLLSPNCTAQSHFTSGTVLMSEVPITLSISILPITINVGIN